MRYFLCAALLCTAVLAQDKASSPVPVHHEGIFFVNGIDYHFISGTQSTVVVAAHSVVNHKYLGVKIRVVNSGDASVTVRPEDVVAQDAVTGRNLQAVGGTELANKMRKPYNWARLGVKMGAGGQPDSTDDNAVDPEHSEMMRMMHQMAGQMGNPGSRSALATTEQPLTIALGPGAVFSDEVSYLRRKEASEPDALLQLQKQNSPEYIEQSTLLANTIPLRGDLAGVLFYPMGKLARDPAAAKTRAQSRVVRVNVPVGGEMFQFTLAIE